MLEVGGIYPIEKSPSSKVEGDHCKVVHYQKDLDRFLVVYGSKEDLEKGFSTGERLSSDVVHSNGKLIGTSQALIQCGIM